MADRKQELACGCVLALDYDKNMAIDYCAKHKTAPDMYEALKQALRTFEAHRIRETDPRYIMLKTALAKAEGKPSMNDQLDRSRKEKGLQ